MPSSPPEDGQKIPTFQSETLSDTEEEEEEEDVDFNPLLTLSPEASSSLSSENEPFLPFTLPKPSIDLNHHAPPESDEPDHPDLPEEAEKPEQPEEVLFELRKGKRKDLELGELEKLGELGKCSSAGPGQGPEWGMCEELGNEEDAICRRTRARYSLADFTLDELENFLQETDDEDEVNVDDEKEYRKFLMAVLDDNGGGGDKGKGNGDDEDEDNDADFEIEIEEALESDREEEGMVGNGKGKGKGGTRGRRVETRQNRRKKAAATAAQKKLLEQSSRPLRPLLPLVQYPNLVASTVFYPQGGGNRIGMQPGLGTGFSSSQLGQLHCLIHEHAQLLVQVYSLCAVDHSRKEIAGTVKNLMTELVKKRDEALSRRKVPYPDYVFRPPYVLPSVTDEIPKIHPNCSTGSSSASGSQQDSRETILNLSSTSFSNGRCNGSGESGRCQSVEDPLWVPSVKGPVLSVLDVAPLSLVTNYVEDVSKAVRAYHSDYSFENPIQREPLFPLSNYPSSPEATDESLRESASQCLTPVSLSSAGKAQPKKSFAAALIENSKKQPIAVAPKKIVKLAQRFHPLFNSALFPHKPPPPPLANRVLFTDTEDELLALGVMECNTDWKAIQQRFLPCKSRHQIFVRQKNRCSSKAPENPIKAVRRMKTSPLTEEEKTRITEGLRVLKLDWMSVWQFIVPYRDPSLLPRQWRIAHGIQKSYKKDSEKREKRRLYEAHKRRCKAAISASWQTASEKEDYVVNNAADGSKSGDDNVEDEDEAYVHEAFLSDWRPGSSQFASSENPVSSIIRRDLQPGSVLAQENNCVSELPGGNGHAEAHEFLSSNFSQHLQGASHFTHVRYNASCTMASNHLSPDCLAKSSKNQVNLLPHRARRRKDAQLVKLAPELPPVNLPPSVRVISQSAFKSYRCVNYRSSEISSASVETENLVSRAQFPISGTSISGHSDGINSTRGILLPQDSRLHSDQAISDDKGVEADLQMHPLLFEAPEDGHLRCSKVDSVTSASNTINFLPGHQLHANFSEFSKPLDAASTVGHFYTSLMSKETPSSSHTIDFHPLLQRTDDLYNDSAHDMSVDGESSEEHFCQLQNPSNPDMTEPHNNSGRQTYAPDLNIPYEKANELDLEIHLSSTSRKKKVVAGKKVTENNYNGSTIGFSSAGITKEYNKDLFNVDGNNSLSFPIAVSASKQGHNLGDCLFASPNISKGYTEDSLGEHSLPQIVMEQEELSDSEEEIEEHVEFECEEMADSEGESDSEQLVNIQGVPKGTLGGEDLTSRVRKGLQSETISACATTRRGTRSCKLELMTGGNVVSDPSLELSLDSFANQLAANNEVGNSEAGKSLSSRPNRSCKRTMPPKAVTRQMHPLELLQQLQLGTAAGTSNSPTKKPRKRGYRNVSTATTAGNLGSICSNNLVNCSPNDACRVNDAPKNFPDVGLMQSQDAKRHDTIGFKS